MKPDPRQSAEAKFKQKELQQADGRKAMAEYEAARRDLVEKTARLRAMRLARDAAASAAAATDATDVRPKRKARS
jgi:hypothetical protein